MTILDLKKEVEALGFTSIGDLDDSLASTANRALRMIHTDHPKRKRGEVVFLPRDAIVAFAPVAGEGSEISLSIPKGRLVMKIRGEGKYLVRIGNEQLTFRFFHDTESLEVDFPDDGELVFTEDSVFCAWDIALLPGATLPFEDAISFTGEAISFDLKKIFPDFLYLTDIPKNIDGRRIDSLTLPDSTHLTVPLSYRGVITFFYSARAEEITVDSADEDRVDLADELTPLLPLLISYFLWIEENPDMAGLYLSEYEKLSRAIRQRDIPGEISYTDVSGWA